MNIDDLERLNNMKEKGIITEEEFKREKEKILNNSSFAQRENESHINDSTNSQNNNHGEYKKWSGIVLIIFGVLLIVNLENASYSNPALVFFFPGLLGLIAGILKLSNKNNSILMTTGIICLVGLLINSIAISDISIYGIVSLIFGIIDIKYANNKNNL